MKMREKQLILGITTVLFLTIIISCAEGTQVETVTVEPLTKEMFFFDLDEGDKFSGSLSISGGANNDIDFWVTNPQGNTIVNLGRISQGKNFEFTAQESGAYTFHFDNTFSLFSYKSVALSYDITNPALLNIAVMIGVLLIAAIIIIGIGVLLYLRKRQIVSKAGQPVPT